MKTAPIVQFKNIKKKIGNRMIIDDITFNVNAGEVFGFLGPNGAGKTTTIRMLFGLISLTDGEIFINGYSVKNEYETAISKVGGIVENPEMYKYLTGYQNLAQYARTYKGVDKARIDEVIELVGLDKRVHDKVKTYSLGMRQRLGLAQALLHRPSLIVLDEPTNGLDPAGIYELRNYLRVLAEKENIAIFISSHLLSEMEMMCDRIGIIQNGKLIDIQMVNDFLSKEKTNRVTFIVDDIQKAKTCLDKIFSNHETRVKENGIEITIDTEQVPDAVIAFVNDNIKIYGIEKATKSLEDKFLELTGGAGIE